MTRISNPALAVALLALAAAPLFGQATESESVPGFGEIVDVRVVNIEVVVTDGKERIEGLGADDFRLLVDGKPVPIEFFTEVRSGQAFEPGAPSTNATAAVSAVAPGEGVGNRILVFIDEYFSRPGQRNRVLRELADQLPLLGGDDRMAIVAFNGRQVELLTSWTRSIPELERVLGTALDRRAFGLQRWFRGQSFQRGSALYADVAKVIDAAASALRGFAQPPGRKVMLLLSGGWPVSESLDAGFLDTTTAGRSALRPLIETANRLGYTLYPVDLPGFRLGAGGSAEFATFEASQSADFSGRRTERIEEDALYELADATGGRALINGASNFALERTLEDLRSYYWLGFSPVWHEDDHVHKIEAEVLREGLKVRSRSSLSDLSRRRETTMRVESAQLFDLPMPGSGGLGVSFGKVSSGGFRKAIVPVRLQIPLDQVTAVNDGGRFVMKLEALVAATDDRGLRADILVIPIELHRRQAPEAGEIATYDTHLLLRRRPHRLLFTIHDPISGDFLSQRTELDLRSRRAGSKDKGLRKASSSSLEDDSPSLRRKNPRKLDS